MQVVEAVTIAAPTGPARLDKAPNYLGHMMIRPLPVAPDLPVQDVGVSCRICDLAECTMRREPAILSDGF